MLRSITINEGDFLSVNQLIVLVSVVSENSELTFQHFDRNLGHAVLFFFVKTQCLSHHHQTEAAFAQRLSKNQSVRRRRNMRQSSQVQPQISIVFRNNVPVSIPVPRQLPAGILG